MSNHSGNYMLNNVLTILQDDHDFFSKIGKEEAYLFVKKIIKVGNRYDCNSGEILEDIGLKLGVCYGCIKQADLNEDGYCGDCS